MLSIGDNLDARDTSVTRWLSKKWVWFIIYSVVIGGTLLWALRPSEPFTTQKAIQPIMEKPTVKTINPNLAQWHVFGEPVPKVTELEQSPWKLQGIVIGADGQGVAIILVNNKPLTLKAGDKISSNVVIDTIEKDKILVMDNGQIKSLTLFKPSSNASSQVANNRTIENRGFSSGLPPNIKRALQKRNLKNR